MSDEDWARLADAELTHDRPLARVEGRRYIKRWKRLFMRRKYA